MEVTDQIAVVEDGPHATRIVLRGRVAIPSVHQLHHAAVAAAARQTGVTVSCREAESLDITAIQVLLCLGRELARNGKPCDISGVAGRAREDFKLMGLSAALPPESTAVSQPEM